MALTLLITIFICKRFRSIINYFLTKLVERKGNWRKTYFKSQLNQFSAVFGWGVSTTCCLLSVVSSYFIWLTFYLMFHYQSFGNPLKKFDGGVLKCKFRISGVNSSSTRANKDLVYAVLLAEGRNGAYTELLCWFPVILTFNSISVQMMMWLMTEWSLTCKPDEDFSKEMTDAEVWAVYLSSIYQKNFYFPVNTMRTH